MGTLVEVAEFVDSILRLDIDTPIRGYDGTDIGPANEQAQVLANRTLYLKENLIALKKVLTELQDREYVASVNEKIGKITLTYSDIDAAPATHTHPASQIETTTDAEFVSTSEKTKWNGKQDKLISGTTLKTLLGNSLLGSGNITINGKDITTTTEFQFVSQTEKDNWGSKQDKLVSGTNLSTLHGINLLSGGDITLTYKEIGAEQSGTVETGIKEHVGEDDPHTQYLNESRANALYIDIDDANKPNGYLKLDSKGQIPSTIAELFEVRYLIVETETERLAIKGSTNITICLQSDENKIYYLDANDDPSVSDNWHSGRDVDPSSVVSVFGRSGIVVAKNGDYTADQITESSTREFVTPEQKTSWSKKQALLVSGTNIKTINKTSLLAGGDIQITPATIGAAEEKHTHTANDISVSDDKQFVSKEDIEKWDGAQEKLVSGTNIKTINKQSLLGDGDILITAENIGAAKTSHTHTPSEIVTDDDNQFVSLEEKKAWSAKQEKLVSGANLSTIFGQSLLKGENISLTDAEDLAGTIYALFSAKDGVNLALDSDNQTITISVDNDKLNIDTVTDAVQGGMYKYKGVEDNFNFIAYALKKVALATDNSFSIDYTQTPDRVKRVPEITFSSNGYIPASDSATTYQLTEADTPYEPFITDEISYPETPINRMGIIVDQDSAAILPTFTENTSGNFSISTERSDGFHASWKSFQKTDAPLGVLADQTYWRDSQVWANKSGDASLIVTCKTSTTIDSYGFQDFSGFASSASTTITGWKFQGRHQTNGNWVELDFQKNQNLIDTGKEWNIYKLSASVSYLEYRLLVYTVSNPQGKAAVSRFQLFNGGNGLIKANDGKFYSVSDEGELIEVAAEDKLYLKGFTETNTPIDISAIKDLFPIRICSEGETSVKVSYFKSVNQTIFDNPLKDFTYWKDLNQLTVAEVFSELDLDTIKTAVTVDGKTYFVLEDESWNSIGELTQTESDYSVVSEKGMKLSVLSDITKSQWMSLIETGDADAKVGLVYASSISSKTDVGVPKVLDVTIDDHVYWKRTSLSEVTITLVRDKIIFSPNEDGEYQFCYRFM